MQIMPCRLINSYDYRKRRKYINRLNKLKNHSIIILINMITPDLASKNLDWKRLSINNLFNEKNQRYDKLDRSSQKYLDKKGKSKIKIQYKFKQYKFQPFDLKQIENNLALIKSNRRFSSLLDTLRLYNEKIKDNRQTDIINYKLYQFFYSTLRICNTKTNSEVDFYLQELQNWRHSYNHKRQFLIQRKNKKKNNKEQQQLIRQTFKSYLPSEIDKYERKICLLSSSKNKDQQQNQNSKRKSNRKKLTGKLYNDSEDSETEEYMRKLEQVQNEKQKKKQEMKLPDLRTYQNQLKKMRKIIQDREQQQLLQKLKKNKTRIQTQSANNFYKPMKNRNDIFIKTSNNFNRQQAQLLSKRLQVQDESQTSKIQGIQDNTKFNLLQKQNLHIVVNSTSLGFHQIKKNKLQNVLGLKKNKTSSSNFPKFFTNNDTFYSTNNFTTKIDELQGQENGINHPSGQQQKLINILGMSLLKNPFQITKIKRQKKKK